MGGGGGSVLGGSFKKVRLYNTKHLIFVEYVFCVGIFFRSIRL